MKSFLPKKIVKLTNYDFRNNISAWMTITSFMAITAYVLFIALSLLVYDVHVHVWRSPVDMLFDWFSRMYALTITDTYGIGFIKVAIVSLGICMIPYAFMKNSLDLAFDSAMSGLSCYEDIGYAVTRRFLTMISCIFFMMFIALLCINLGVSYLSIKKFYLWKGLFYFIGWGLMWLCMVVYLACLHVIEYRHTLYVSLQEFFSMIAGRSWLLMHIFVRATLVMYGSYVIIAFGLHAVIEHFFGIFLWVFEHLYIPVSIPFILFLYNFGYLWAYCFVYAWCSLLFAHLYRHLVCPPVENVGCTSCTSCKN